MLLTEEGSDATSPERKCDRPSEELAVALPCVATFFHSFRRPLLGTHCKVCNFIELNAHHTVACTLSRQNVRFDKGCWVVHYARLVRLASSLDMPKTWWVIILYNQ